VADGQSDVSQAAQRLERALTALEARVRALKSQSGAGASDLFDQDRARLAEELDESRAREAQLEELAFEACEAVERAMTEVRAALDEVA
jgi:ElaB/YqjD/DUF883 family membrane-anchored ribosome-binding protein